MGRDDQPSEEVLDLGVVEEPTGEGRPGRSSRPAALSRRGLLGVGGLAALAGAWAVASSRASSPASSAAQSAASSPAPSPGPARPPAPSPSASVRPSATVEPSAPTAPRAAVAVTDLGRPLLGATDTWDLFARGEDVVLRIRPASGRITRTALPPLGDADVSLVPARGRVLIHPTDYRQGYLVMDDRPVTEMPPGLDGAGPMLPGPDVDHV
ncbi:MAG TPA: hypothetical protein VMT69_05960, partial [Kineosporiaceae bacterium]|nr:hypothetical protein [Kineosporiaceae bacterium]